MKINEWPKSNSETRKLWSCIRRKLNFTQGDQYGTWKSDFGELSKQTIEFLDEKYNEE